MYSNYKFCVRGVTLKIYTKKSQKNGWLVDKTALVY